MRPIALLSTMVVCVHYSVLVKPFGYANEKQTLCLLISEMKTFEKLGP